MKRGMRVQNWCFLLYACDLRGKILVKVIVLTGVNDHSEYSRNCAVTLIEIV